MTEQIYINGVLMDTQEGKNASLIYQSPYFTDIDNIVSSRTTSVEFPATRNNLMAIDRANLPSIDSKFEYNRHSVVYCRDGLQVFSGSGTLLSLLPSSMKFSFVWGNVSVFQKLLNANLHDLQEEGDYVGYSDAVARTNKFYYPKGWDSRYNWGGVGAGSIQPLMPVSQIMERITKRFGITMSFPGGNTPFNDYYLPLISRNADEYSRAQQGVVINSIATVDVLGYYNYTDSITMPCVMKRLTGVEYDIGGLNNNGVIDVSGIDRLTLQVKAGFKFKVQKEAYQQTLEKGLRIIATDDEGKYYRSLGVISAKSVVDGNMYIMTIDKDSKLTINVSKYERVAVIICAILATNNLGFMGASSVIMPTKTYVFNSDLECLTFSTNAIFPLYTNLPDWTISQLIKNLMKIEGLFAYAENDTDIRFVSIGDIYSRRHTAYDWSDKLMLSKGSPTEKSTSFNSLAQRNLCKYTEDETVTGNYDGYIEVKNETIEAESELITLDFAPTSDGKINIWKKNDEGNYEYNEVEPRILKLQRTEGVSNGAISFDGLDWSTLIKTKYYNYQNLVRYLHVIKATVHISSLELKQLDLVNPAYARQWGHYYAISKLTTKNNDTAEVELLRMGRASIYEESAGEPEDDDDPKDLQLKLVSNGNGTYHVTLANTSDETIQEYIKSKEYHLCLVRYGYARRGKKGKKKDRLFGEIGTHTDRKRDYRRYRNGLTWRIIGHDILKRANGTRPANSQMTKSPIYTSATLVFELGETIVLPKMRASNASVSSKGRIRNTSARGITDLYIGMYRKTTNETSVDHQQRLRWGWECVTNKVQVRGTNSTRTRYWEFEKANERVMYKNKAATT